VFGIGLRVVTVPRMTAPERNRQPTVVKVSDLSSMVVAVEHMVGFRPDESIVAVALCGPRERMTFCMRLDLPLASDGEDVTVLFAQEVAKRMAYAGADAVMLFVHTSERPTGGLLPYRSLVDAIEAALDVPLREAALVTSHRLWSYVCDDARCCPPEGRPLERQSSAALALAAEHAALGNVVLDSREELLASVRPVGGIAAVSMRQAQERAVEAVIEQGVVAFAGAVERAIDELAQRFTDPRASLTDDEAARVVIGLADKPLRDHMFVVLSDPGSEGLQRLLSAVARRAQPPHDAPVCTCVGFAEYIGGSGVLAHAALERALATDPDYVMAQYLMTMLQHQVSPAEVRSCGSAIAEGVAARLRSRRRRR
jgi:hypothetical protein